MRFYILNKEDFKFCNFVENFFKIYALSRGVSLDNSCYSLLRMFMFSFFIKINEEVNKNEKNNKN